MPSIRKKFAGFIRQFSNPSTSDCLDSSAGAHPPKSLSNLDSSGCFIQRYLQGESRLKQPDILFGRTGQELPCLRLCSLQNHVVAAHTGPDSGLTSVNQGSQNAHVTSLDPDVSYIDSDDEPNASAALSTPPGKYRHSSSESTHFPRTCVLDLSSRYANTDFSLLSIFFWGVVVARNGFYFHVFECRLWYVMEHRPRKGRIN